MSEAMAAIDDEELVAPRQSRVAVPPIRPTDGERLMRFWRHRDQAALAEVIEQHAGMVWGVCSQVLRHREDIEDAFQATFLILARKARSIRAADSAAGWLYRVAFRTALLARSRRRRLAEMPLEYEPASSDDDQLEAIARSEQCRVLLEELHALPLQYRQPLVLCYLEGRSRSEAADELGVTPQSVKGRLARGTRMLRSRMAGRGVALSTTMAITTASIATANAATPATLIPHTAALAGSFAWKLTAGTGSKATAVKTAAATLAEKGILSMTLVAAAKPAVALLGACLTAGTLAVASADVPKGDSRGAAVVLLANADAEFGSAAEEPDNDVTVEAAADEPTGDGRLSTIAAEQARPEDDLPASPADPLEQQLIASGVLAPGPMAPAAPPAAPGPPADVIAQVRAPLAASFSFANSANPFAAMGDAPMGRGMDPYMEGMPGGMMGEAMYGYPMGARRPAPLQASATPSSAGLAGSNERSLKLEQEYWDLKAQGLKLKAEAIEQKAQAMEESDRGTQPEILELKAEAGLIEADLKLCEINALRVNEQLKALTASQLKRGSKGVQVRMLQQQLNARLTPSPKLEVDGDFGFLTEEAVKLFQKANELETTGVVDERTAMILGLAIHPRAGGLTRTSGSGGGVIFSRGGDELHLELERALARAREAAELEEKAHDQKAEADARRQQIKALQDALHALQQQQEAAEEKAETNDDERPSTGWFRGTPPRAF